MMDRLRIVAESIGWTVVGMSTLILLVVGGYVCFLAVSEYVVKWLRLGEVFLQAGRLIRDRKSTPPQPAKGEEEKA